MYLRALEILGFKSFANKTVVKFSNGVTAIVGPNGCGKTNVLDALRWVLGEQRPTMLRGGRMEEVIFNGTRDLKPLGMSEVTLTVVNDRGVLPTEYHEVQITRRLFRSGDSEYLMNKVPCRLKDITDLFVDTGMGAHSYSVIQQDMIESVISDKAEERRFLFEEAAGITKYKHRKRAALRKLESTEADFNRLRDIHSEVKTQVNSLYRQHKKAERYQTIADDVRAWDLYLSSSRLKSIDLEKRQLRAECDALTDTRTGKAAELDEASLRLETERQSLLEIEHNLNTVSSQVYELSESAHTKEREISVLREKRTNAANLIDKNSGEIASLTSRVTSLDEQIIIAGKELAEVQLALERSSNELHEAESAQAELDRRLFEARASREDVNRRLIEIESRLSSGKTEEKTLREQETELAESLAAIEAQIAATAPRREELNASIAKGQQEAEQLLARRREFEEAQTALTAEMERLVDLGEELSLDIANLSASIEACEARRNLLNDMMVHYEGHDSGLVAAMEQRGRWPGIYGTVAEKLVPVAGLELALEAALGNLAGFMICKDRATAEEIIKFLKEDAKGKVGILVPETGTINPVVRRPEIPSENFLGWLESYVSTDPELRPLVEAVLSRTAVFRAGADPSDILERLPYGFSAVSGDGVYYGKNVIAGGSSDRFPLFRRKEKVQEQEQAIADFASKLEAARDRKAQTTTQLAAARAESTNLVGSLDRLADEAEIHQKSLSELEFQLRSLSTEFDRLEKEKLQARNRLDAIRNRQYSLGLDYTELAGQKENIVTSASQVAGRLDEFERSVAEAVERTARLQVATVEARSKVEQTQSRIGHFKEIRRELDQTVEVKKTEIENAHTEIRTAEERHHELETDLKSTFEMREELLHSQETLRGQQGEVLERTTAKEKLIKQLRDERDSVGEKIHQLDIRLNTIDSEIRSSHEKILTEYGLDLTTVEIACPNPTIPEDAAREHLQTQREMLRKFGAVNLLALEEYRTTSEREKFLSEQLNDLTAARNDLQATILKINQTARQLFMETFDKARDNFKNLFQELFSGGEADILLEDPSDPLESNIEIIARPRGKKLLSITMMSGGERALTAISLLFALYLVKPSPFCILDEIDAPLDDANCHRFLKIIRKFSRQTQFITITHNKITME
ncbi:MAG: chromosome segregation protein SMC, partial [Candidatus Zixiibacteriota bacterium]